jgi:chemotaxis regulatin CheY-phosphate phosphatase CheZ
LGDDTFSESELLDKSHELAKELETPLREVMMSDDIEDISGFLAERFCE